MQSFQSNLPERMGRPRPSLPNLRGEDEAELAYLTELIESLCWVLFPAGHVSCVLGKHPRPQDSTSTYCAAIYTIGKGGLRSLAVGPELGESRIAALKELLGVVEVEIGKMTLRDAKEARRMADQASSSRSGNSDKGQGA